LKRAIDRSAETRAVSFLHYVSPLKKRGGPVMSVMSVMSGMSANSANNIGRLETCELVADRFLRFDNQRVIDLATGDEVLLVAGSAGGTTEQRVWALRCDWFFGIRHRAIAELVDYGVIGETRRFEAWRCGPPWRGANRASVHARELAATFLRANGRTVKASLDTVGSSREGRAVLVPGADTGYLCEREPFVAPVPIEACGIQIVAPRAVPAIAELFDERCPREPRVIALTGPRGAGLATAMNELSRAARLAGFVPLSASVSELPIRAALAGRSLFVMASSLDPAASWQAFLDWTMESPRPHLFLFAGIDPVSRIPEVRLQPLPVESRPTKSSATSRAAEQATTYGDETVRVPDPASVVDLDPWPAPGELAALGRRMDAALAQLAAGRHEPGQRALRSVVAGLARRRDWHTAARGALGLASALLSRGRPRDAQHVLAQAKDYCRQAADGTTADAAILSGVVWISDASMRPRAFWARR
jgi:hypothetical protein